MVQETHSVILSEAKDLAVFTSTPEALTISDAVWWTTHRKILRFAQDDSRVDFLMRPTREGYGPGGQ